MSDQQAVNLYIDTSQHWKGELMLLRATLLSAGLEETMKWQRPVYMKDGTNLISLAAFKEYVGLWFFQGGLLADEEQKLVNAQEGKTKAMRHWKFYNMTEIQQNKKIISAYIQEAIDNHDAGKRIKVSKNTKPLTIPDELQTALNQNKQLQTMFESFSLSKKREFAEYISEAKRDATKIRRLDKISKLILDGKGLHDVYKR